MKYLSVAEIAKKWNTSERTVRNYCASGKIPEAFITGKTWNIPESAIHPKKQPKGHNNLLKALREEKDNKLSGGIYHKIQIELTYNSNHIEGSKLTHDQTRYIFETNTIGIDSNKGDATEQAEGTAPNSSATNIDDIVETVNHFQCIDMVIDQANYKLSEHGIKKLHAMLKHGTKDARTPWFALGDYKKLPNEVGGNSTTHPKKVASAMAKLLAAYNQNPTKTFEDILDFHYQFERIHPFQDGNGRVGRLIMFKECLRNNIVPFIIEDKFKMFYYRGLSQWNQEQGYLLDTCLSAQDTFKAYLDYFEIPYKA